MSWCVYPHLKYFFKGVFSLVQENILGFSDLDYLVTSWTLQFQSVTKQNYYAWGFLSVPIRSFSFPFLREITQVFSQGKVLHSFGTYVFIVICVSGLLRCPEYRFNSAALFPSWVEELVITESQDCGLWWKTPSCWEKHSP